MATIAFIAGMERRRRGIASSAGWVLLVHGGGSSSRKGNEAVSEFVNGG
eukprot:COSAG05_NODE_1322_length_5190_cov_6.444507_7_plen_49_part_00